MRMTALLKINLDIHLLNNHNNSMEYTHPCMKCHEKYTDTDPDQYLCAKCNEERKIIAARVDATIATRPSKPRKSLLQEYDESPKMRGFQILKLSDL